MKILAVSNYSATVGLWVCHTYIIIYIHMNIIHMHYTFFVNRIIEIV